MPSLGQVNWEKLIPYVKAHGYDSYLSIEHEDPVYEGSKEKVEQGLRIGLEYLQKIV